MFVKCDVLFGERRIGLFSVQKCFHSSTASLVSFFLLIRVLHSKRPKNYFFVPTMQPTVINETQQPSQHNPPHRHLQCLCHGCFYSPPKFHRHHRHHLIFIAMPFRQSFHLTHHITWPLVSNPAAVIWLAHYRDPSMTSQSERPEVSMQRLWRKMEGDGQHHPTRKVIGSLVFW